MSEPDLADEKAAELLPCFCGECVEPPYHLFVCPARYIPAVAAALRQEGQEWQTVVDYARGHGVEGSLPGDLQALIEDQRGEIERLKAEADKERRELIAEVGKFGELYR